MATMIEALHKILERESAKPEGKGESLEHATIREMGREGSPVILTPELLRRAQETYPEEFAKLSKKDGD